MSEGSDKKSGDELSVISFDDAVRFFNTVTPGRVCPHCGGDRFEINSSPESLDFAQTISMPLYGHAKKVIPVIIAGCRTCGALFPHKHKLISEWLSNNPCLDTDGGQALDVEQSSEDEEGQGS